MDSMFYTPFACNEEEDGACLGIKWKKWRRGFEIFLRAKGITEDNHKKNLLLQCAGPVVEDIFFTLPESKDFNQEHQYDLTMQALDRYFSPKSNTVYERYVFRSLRQQPGESIDHFVTKLLEHGKHCKYTDLDDQVRDQVIEKCLSSELRWNILEKRDITLEELREIAKAFEALELQGNFIDGTSDEMMSKLKIQEEHSCSSPTRSEFEHHSVCCKGARPEGQRSEQADTFSISEETAEERIPCNRMHDPAVEKKTGFW